MAPIPPLFSLPVKPNGEITCTRTMDRVYNLTFALPPDNRLTREFCNAFLLALDILEHRFAWGVVVTTSSIPKFYSNGLNYESAIGSKTFLGEVLYPFWRRLLTYPMPTIALVNGHAFAGGLMTTMMHDYRFMNPHRGYLCLNELEFGAPLKPAMSSIFRAKVTSPNTYRTLVLEAKRYNALEALKEGLVDGLGDFNDIKTFIEEFHLLEKAKSGVYGLLKAEMWKETIADMDKWESRDEEIANQRAQDKERRVEQQRRVEEWERSNPRDKAKL